VIATALAASLTTNLMKLAIARPRPTGDIALRDFSGYSFPSGHSTSAAALWGALAVALVWTGHLRLRGAVAGWLVVTVLVAASRVVLGAHWLTDVVAGIAVGTGCVAVAVLIAAPRGGGWGQPVPTERGAPEGEHADVGP
jgi:undecaprenyl-diphosphatase